MSINHISKCADSSLVIHVDGQDSRRLDNNVTNLVYNPEHIYYPCLSFDGVDDIVRCDSPTDVTSNSDFSLIFRVSALNPTLKNIFRYSTDDWTKGVVLQVGTNAIYFYVNSSNANIVNTTLGWIKGKWHDVCITKKYSESYSKLYIDGVPAIVNTGTSRANINIQGTGKILEIGGKSTGLYPSYCQAYTKDVCVYGRVLTPSDVLAFSSVQRLDQTGLISKWGFNEGSGSVVTDSSDNGNNGTIYGAIRQDGKANGTLIGGVSYKNSPIGKSVLNFDGTTGYIRHQIINNSSSNLSCYVWAKAPFESYIIGCYDTGLLTRSWLIGTDQANEKRMRVLLSSTGAYGSGTSKDYVTVNNVFDDQWHLYGFSFNAGTLRLDVDGIPQAVTKTSDVSFTSIYDVSADVIVGARTISDTPAGFYTGLVGEYYLYNRSYSPSESSILYNETRRSYGK